MYCDNNFSLLHLCEFKGKITTSNKTFLYETRYFTKTFFIITSYLP